MKLTYKIARKNPEVSELCKIAFKNKLFVKGWMLKDYLRSEDSLGEIAIAYDKNNPIGVAVITSYTGLIMVFVKGEYRRNGIGTKLILKLKPSKRYYIEGIKGSLNFYKQAMKKIDK